MGENHATATTVITLDCKTRNIWLMTVQHGQTLKQSIIISIKAGWIQQNIIEISSRISIKRDIIMAQSLVNALTIKFSKETAQTGCWSPKTLQSVPGALSSGEGLEADHSSPSRTNVENAWSYTFIPPYAFVKWCLTTHRDNFYAIKMKAISSSEMLVLI